MVGCGITTIGGGGGGGGGSSSSGGGTTTVEDGVTSPTFDSDEVPNMLTAWTDTRYVTSFSSGWIVKLVTAADDVWSTRTRAPDESRRVTTTNRISADPPSPCAAHTATAAPSR